MKVRTAPDALEELRHIAKSCDAALAEATKIIGLLEQFERVKDTSSQHHWNNIKKNTGYVVSFSEIPGNTPIWRLFPDNIYCIALLIERSGWLRVEAFCSSKTLSSIEIRLIDGCLNCNNPSTASANL